MTSIGKVVLFIGGSMGVGLLGALVTNPSDPAVVARLRQEQAAKAAAAEQARQDRIDEAERIRKAEEHGAADDPCPDVSDVHEHLRCFARSMPR